MSIVTVQLGQCGNQVGHQFFQTLMMDLASSESRQATREDASYRSDSLQRFFKAVDAGPSANGASRSSAQAVPSARAVLVDMEGKVVENVAAQAKRSKLWTYAHRNQVSRRRGAGNNWADGFHGQGPRVEEEVLDRVQGEVEGCDALSGLLTLMSVAGGTGSGVGTRLTLELRDRYPKTFLLNHLVWPHATGEVILQNYNAVLSLAHLYQSADAVLVSQNDSLRTVCGQLASTAKKEVTFHDMNKLVAQQMGVAFQPAFYGSSSARKSATFGWMLQHLVPHADYKLLTLRGVPQVSESALTFSTFNYRSLISRLRQMQITRTVIEEGLNWHVKLPSSSAPSSEQNKSLATLLSVRGRESSTADMSEFCHGALYADWVPTSAAFAGQWHERPFGGREKAATSLSNCRTPLAGLERVLGKAWGMFAVRAYVHWYTRYGMTEEEFIDCFACLEQVVQNYKEI